MKDIGLLLAVMLLSSCGWSLGTDDEAQQAAASWAESYFNCDYMKALELSTKESERWLRFAASNTTEEDLRLLQEQQAIVEDAYYYTQANDTLAIVALEVKNYIAPTPLEGKATQAEEAGTFLVTVVKRNGSWKVRMEGLPRSERQSRD